MADLVRSIKHMFDLLLMGDAQGILFWATVFITMACLASFWIQWRVAAWPSVIGKLNMLKIGGTGPSLPGDQGHYYLEAEYEYSVDGVNYKGNNVSLSVIWTRSGFLYLLRRQIAAVNQMPGEKVEVFYNPNKPQKSYLIKSSDSIRALTLVPIFFMIWLYTSAY